MAGSSKATSKELFGKISAYSTIVQQNLGKFLNKFSPYAKEYESTLELVLDILRSLGYSQERIVAELIELVTGEASIGGAVESGYHGTINSLESKIAQIELNEENDSFINRLEDVVKVTISTILTNFLTCSISPFIPKGALDKIYKEKYSSYPFDYSLLERPISIPTHILDFSNTLHVSPVSESGMYFYNTKNTITYYKLYDKRNEAGTATVADVREKNAEKYVIYSYKKVNAADLNDEEKSKAKKVVSAVLEVKKKENETPPPSVIYTVRCDFTAESLYKTDDMNAFIWYVANRGDNFDESRTNGSKGDSNVMYEYNKMAWDSRRANNWDGEKRREGKDWDDWLKSRTSWNGELKLEKNGEIVESLFPVLQFEPSESWGNLEHLIVTFPAQRYLVKKKILGKEVDITKTIYKFNADYLRSIRLFNWKTIVMNMLYELNGISPIPDIQFNLSLSDEIIDAKLSTLILDTIIANDKEVDDSYYSFSNEDYAEALKKMELKKYGAKSYITAGSPAIQNPLDDVMKVANSISTAATLNEIKSTITRGAYSLAGSSGSTGITKTTLSANLAIESNFIYELLSAIVKPFVRALLSPQVILLFCINLDVMGLINLKDLGRGDFDLLNDFIFRKLSGIIKKLIIQVKDMIILYLLDIVKKEIKKLVDEIIILLLLEQLNDYIRLLTQIMECIRLFGIGKTITGIDEVNYADIIPEAKGPTPD